MVIRKLKTFIPSVMAAGIVVKLSGLIKFSFIVGSSMAFFSGSSIAMPLVGSFGSLSMAVGVVGLLSLMHGAWVGMGSLQFLAYHIPGLVAAASWSAPSLLIRVILPLVCMAAFIAHPEGGAAWLYTLYWLIPAGLYMSGRVGLFAMALSSTFIAHAVGSVIWIYTVPMTSAQWLALIPVVAVERLLFAAGMVVVYHSVMMGKKFISKIGTVRRWVENI